MTDILDRISDSNITVCICRVNYRRAEETPEESTPDTSHSQQVSCPTSFP